ncbi:MAG: YfhL family 4Fe-4S dicluster ferredoxin [Myxococcota bacterium]
MITEECISCGACEPQCPNAAISMGEDLYVIDPTRCTECVGFHDEEQCAAVCPVDVCLPDPDREESEAELLSRAKRLHPNKVFPAVFPSRFR